MRAGVAALTVLLLAAGCGRRAYEPKLAMETPASGGVALSGLDDATLDKLKRLGDRPETWAPVFSVAVGPGLPPVSGRYSLEHGVARFTPDLPPEPGRSYLARFDPQALGLAGRPPIAAALATPGAPRSAPARVAMVSPSSPVWPANILRLYVRFSAPMAVGKPGTLRLLDAGGKALDEPFLPLGYEFWSPDRTRLTVLLDPGRVKRGVVPGPILTPGARYTLVVGADWRDATGAPLASEFRLDVEAGPPTRGGLAPDRWRLTPPATGSRAPLRIAFDRPLDRGLLFSALGVAGTDGAALAGEAEVTPGETAWTFTPSRPWADGPHRLLIQPWLEDPQGNRPGKPFEQMAGQAGEQPGRNPIDLPFRPTPAAGT